MLAPVLASFIDRQAEAFELALNEDTNTSIRQFLPGSGHREYFPLLVELIRIDMELAWRRDERRRMRYYLVDFPELQGQTTAIERIAFEEYRQRRLAGEHITPRDYFAILGFEPKLWPPIRSHSPSTSLPS